MPLTTTDAFNAVKFVKDLTVKSDKYTLDVPQLNYIAGDILLLCKILDMDEIMSRIAKPRPEITTTPRPKTPWTFEKSFFTQYFENHDDLMAECFEFDWESSKIPRIIKNEEEL